MASSGSYDGCAPDEQDDRSDCDVPYDWVGPYFAGVGDNGSNAEGDGGGQLIRHGELGSSGGRLGESRPMHGGKGERGAGVALGERLASMAACGASELAS